MITANFLTNPFIWIYIVLILFTSWVTHASNEKKKANLNRRRQEVGLDEHILTDYQKRLRRWKQAAKRQAFWLLSVFVGMPGLLIFLYFLGKHWEPARLISPANFKGQLLVFLGAVVWLLYSGSEVGRSLIGGLAFRTLVAMKTPIQVGDRVLLEGHHGTIEDIGVFYIRLVTLDQDIVHIPTAGLWSKIMLSANRGVRSCLVSMNFYLAPSCDAERCQAAEDAIWEAIQASPYLDFTGPLDIFLTQKPAAIQLTARAYVAAVSNELHFKSDVTHAFLRFATTKGIPLAATRWEGEADD